MKRESASSEWLSEDLGKTIDRVIDQSAGSLDQCRHRIVTEIMAFLRDRYGGGYLYIPSSLDARREAIRSAFNGRNAAAVAEQHGVSRSTVYRLTRRRQP